MYNAKKIKVIRYIKYKSSLHIVHTLSIYNMYKYDTQKKSQQMENVSHHLTFFHLLTFHIIA